MFPVIHIGPVAVQTAGLFVLASIWIGMTLVEKRAGNSGIQSASLDNLILYSLVGFIVGGRLSYTALHWVSFQTSPLDLFSLNTSLFDLAGGLAAGVITALVYGHRKTFPFWRTLDALTPFFAMLLVGISFSHLASGDAYGKETSMPWGIELYGKLRHPSQVYEIAAALAVLFFIGLQKPFPIAGIRMLSFTAWTAASHLFLEAFRGDSNFLPGGFRLEQILAWLILAAALIGVERLQLAYKDDSSNTRK
jgi:phosphatidylglycerol:prolipoprotein diacylglycerol transferase